MIVEHNFKYPHGQSAASKSVNEPEHCPLCKHAIRPVTLASIVYRENPSPAVWSVMYACPSCLQTFIARYDDGKTEYRYVAPQIPAVREFSERLTKLSPNFVSIYNQALAAEAYNLDEVAGMGYRKALEFLIKDYLIAQDESQAETIRNMELSNCIANKVPHFKLKELARRVAWLGNDHAHYQRKFEEYDLSDLKALLDGAIGWVELELTTEAALEIRSRR